MLTINLLPENIKKELNQKIILATVKNITGLFFAAVIFISIILLWAKILSVNNFNNAIEQATQVSQEYGGINQEIRKVNDKISTISQIQKEYIVWSDAVKRILLLIPSDVSIDYLSLSEPGKFVTLKGTAETRESLLTFKSNLESCPLFSKVEIPISYFLSRENINFEINLTTNKDAFK
jgi:Tfp pilus assembly protein PilN